MVSISLPQMGMGFAPPPPPHTHTPYNSSPEVPVKLHTFLYKFSMTIHRVGIDIFWNVHSANVKSMNTIIYC